MDRTVPAGAARLLDFMAGKISRTEFGKRLAQEWASFPVLTVCNGASRHLNRGQTRVDRVQDSIVGLSNAVAALSVTLQAMGTDQNRKQPP